MEKIGKIPTTTVTIARIAMYQPTRRPIVRHGDWITTAHGRCCVTGRLGQRHADVVEAIMYCAENQQRHADGSMELLVDPAQVRRTLSDSNYSYSRMWIILREIMSVVVEIETGKIKVMGHIIDHVVNSPMTRRDPLTRGKRYMWRVRLGFALVMLIDQDLHLQYNPAPIARLKYGISQAMARYVFTHRSEPGGGWFLNTVIAAVMGNGTPDQEQQTGQTIRDARRHIRADRMELADMGIIVTGDRIMCERRTVLQESVVHRPDSVV
jgi:hypothetical protein